MGLPYRLQIFNFVVQWGKADGFYAGQLLARPREEVGAALGISPVTVRVRIHRARGTLRPLLSGDGALALLGARA